MFLIACLSLCGCGARNSIGSKTANSPAQPASLKRIVVSPDHRGFVTKDSRTPFVPWGMNYGNDLGLMEDFWGTNWQVLTTDFRELKRLGANVVRVHLQFGKFMKGPSEPDGTALGQFSRLLHLAEETRLHLDVTGLACYRPADAPEWYDAMDESARWAAQAQFWVAVAKVCRSSPAVFCYDLMNEPTVPGSKRESGQWRSGHLLGEFDFVQFITLDPGKRMRSQIAFEWIQQMAAAIHSQDTNHLVTVGLLPWSRDWKHLSGFVPARIAPEVDFISVHLYPDSKKPGEALEALGQCAAGKPIVIEETFPLSCGVKELEEFLRASREIACGWVGHYGGDSPEDLDALERAGKLSIAKRIYREWLRMFVRLRPEFVEDR
jgi:hypothetical protein